MRKIFLTKEQARRYFKECDEKFGTKTKPGEIEDLFLTEDDKKILRENFRGVKL